MGLRFLQDRLHVQRRARRGKAQRRRRNRGLPPGSRHNPKRNRAKRHAAWLRGADTAERGPGGCDAGEPGHRAEVRARGRRRGGCLSALRRSHRPQPGLSAGSFLDQRSRLPDRAPERGEARGLGRSRRALRRAAVVQRSPARPRRLGARDHAATAAAGLHRTVRPVGARRRMSEFMLERLPHMAYGGDYNPDQWPEEVWEEDVRLMQESGVNLVSIGIFSWSRLEPQQGRFDFAWLDRIMDMLHEGGVRVDLATATASPPPWLSHAHPEMLPVTVDGVRLWHGARQHYCPSSPVYRDAARSLAGALAARYANHPALAMWHVGNEFGCHVAACYCDVSAAGFRAWLQEPYGDIESLNRAWGTDFWSQRYSDWDEVLPPRRTPTWPNPSQQLDFMRFSSDALLECYDIEHAVLTDKSPGVPVTTNFMRFFKPLDYWK